MCAVLATRASSLRSTTTSAPDTQPATNRATSDTRARPSRTVRRANVNGVTHARPGATPGRSAASGPRSRRSAPLAHPPAGAAARPTGAGRRVASAANCQRQEREREREMRQAADASRYATHLGAKRSCHVNPSRAHAENNSLIDPEPVLSQNRNPPVLCEGRPQAARPQTDPLCSKRCPVTRG
jgi:hypothetical protein